MNPFTKFLSQWSNDEGLDEFITYWDRLEHLTIGIYREKVSVKAVEPEFYEVWFWLGRQYGRWQPILRPYWQQTSMDGQPTPSDPFQLLLDIPEPEAILGNWKIMQHLPAAREAINQLLLANSDESI